MAQSQKMVYEQNRHKQNALEQKRPQKEGAKMSTMVSARIPNDVYERGVKRLKHIDSNVTDLVKSAFEYVIVSEKLPTEDRSSISPGKKKLTGKKAVEFNEMFAGGLSSINLPENFDYKEDLSSEMRRDYEALSV